MLPAYSPHQVLYPLQLDGIRRHSILFQRRSYDESIGMAGEFPDGFSGDPASDEHCGLGVASWPRLACWSNGQASSIRDLSVEICKDWAVVIS